MKKISIALCLFLLSFSLFAQILGDVNGTGNINMVDALLIAQYYVNIYNSIFNPNVADVNCDNRIDIVDAMLVAQRYVELIWEFPCNVTPSPVPTPTPTTDPAIGRVLIYPETRTVTSGQRFTTGIRVNTGYLFSYIDYSIFYDDDKIKVDISQGLNGVVDEDRTPCTTFNVVNLPGELQIIQNCNAKFAYENSDNYTIHWVAPYYTSGTSQFTIEVYDLVDGDYKEVPNQRGIPGSVNVLYATPMPGAGEMWFSKNPYTYYLPYINLPTYISAKVNMGDQPIQSFKVRVAYNPGIISIDNVQGFDSPYEFDISYSNSNGMLTITGNKKDNIVIEPSTNYYLFGIDCTGIGYGRTDLDLIVDELNDTSGLPIGDPEGISNYSIEVLRTATPMPGSVFFHPDSQTVNGGEKFTTPLRFATLPDEYAYYDLSISYNDNTYISIDTSEGFNGVTVGNNCFVSSVQNNTGEIRITGSGGPYPGTGNEDNLIIHWVSGYSVSGTCTLDLELDALRDRNGQEIGFVVSWDGEIEVLYAKPPSTPEPTTPPPTPDPTPAPTVVPTPTVVPVNITADLELPISPAWGGTNHWIPNTGEDFGPFKVKITAMSSGGGDFTFAGDFEALDILPPLDDNFDAAETGNSNIKTNKGTCQYSVYARKTGEDPVLIKIFQLNSGIINNADRYSTVFSAINNNLKVDDDNYLYYDNNGTVYKDFAINAQTGTGTIRPGDDLRFRFAVADYPEFYTKVGDEGFMAVYDKKLLWRANLFIDEGANDWNDLNLWNDPVNNDWQNYVDYNNNNTVTNSNGQQIPIVSWTHPEHVHYRLDDNGNVTNIIDWMVTCRTVTNAVAYSWAASDTLFHFNNDVDDQRDAMNQEYDATHEQWPNWNNTIAPVNDWSNYLTTTYRPGYSILTHCNQTNPAGSDLAEKAGDAYRSAGTDCCGFITRVVSYDDGNAYQVAVNNPDEREVFNDDGVNRPYVAIGGANGFAALSWEIENINLLVPGDIVYMYTPGVHIAIINKITYTNEDERTTNNSHIDFIEATTWGLQWSVQNTQSAEDYSSRNYVLYFSRLIP